MGELEDQNIKGCTSYGPLNDREWIKLWPSVTEAEWVERRNAFIRKKIVFNKD